MSRIFGQVIMQSYFPKWEKLQTILETEVISVNLCFWCWKSFLKIGIYEAISGTYERKIGPKSLVGVASTFILKVEMWVEFVWPWTLRQNALKPYTLSTTNLPNFQLRRDKNPQK